MKVVFALLLLLSVPCFSQSVVGRNAEAIIGQDYLKFGEIIEFEEYVLHNPKGGYMIPKDSHHPDADFGLSNLYSDTHIYFFFLKFENHAIKKALILDVLELKRSDLGNSKITEYCETKSGPDSEIFALVPDKEGNPEYYTQIVKAWRANRDTGKFETLRKRKIRRCGNESYGI